MASLPFQLKADLLANLHADGRWPHETDECSPTEQRASSSHRLSIIRQRLKLVNGNKRRCDSSRSRSKRRRVETHECPHDVMNASHSNTSGLSSTESVETADQISHDPSRLQDGRLSASECQRNRQVEGIAEAQGGDSQNPQAREPGQDQSILQVSSEATHLLSENHHPENTLSSLGAGNMAPIFQSNHDPRSTGFASREFLCASQPELEVQQMSSTFRPEVLDSGIPSNPFRPGDDLEITQPTAGLSANNPGVFDYGVPSSAIIHSDCQTLGDSADFEVFDFGIPWCPFPQGDVFSFHNQ